MQYVAEEFMCLCMRTQISKARADVNVTERDLLADPDRPPHRGVPAQQLRCGRAGARASCPPHTHVVVWLYVDIAASAANPSCAHEGSHTIVVLLFCKTQHGWKHRAACNAHARELSSAGSTTGMSQCMRGLMLTTPQNLMLHVDSPCAQYLEAWLGGLGCVPLYNLMEDAATAEICRTQVLARARSAALAPPSLSEPCRSPGCTRSGFGGFPHALRRPRSLCPAVAVRSRLLGAWHVGESLLGSCLALSENTFGGGSGTCVTVRGTLMTQGGVYVRLCLCQHRQNLGAGNGAPSVPGGTGCQRFWTAMHRCVGCVTAAALWVQVWQWLRHGAVVDGKQALTAARFDQLLKEEMAKLRRCGLLWNPLGEPQASTPSIPGDCCLETWPATAQELLNLLLKALS